MIRWSAASVLCVVLLVASVSSAFAQKGDDAFRDGLDALKDQRWQEAEKHFRTAIALDSKETDRVIRTGFLGRFGGGQPYVPYVFLGEALANQGRCLEAIAAWTESEDQKVVAGLPEAAKTLQNGYGRCETNGVLSPSRFSLFRDRATKELSDASVAAGATVKRGEANSALWTDDMRADYIRVTSEIESGRKSLETAQKTRSLEDFTRVGAAAERARTTLGTVNARLDAAIKARDVARGQAGDVQRIIEGAEEQDRSIDQRGTALTATLGSRRQSGRDALARARTGLADAQRTLNTAALSEARTNAENATKTFREVFDDLAKLEQEATQQRLDRVISAARQGFSFADGASANLDRLISERPTGTTPELMTSRDDLRKLIASLRRRLDAAAKAGDVAAVEGVTRAIGDAKNRLDTLSQSFGPLTLVDRGVHTALEQASKLFFSGEYQQVLSALNPPEGFAPDVPLAQHIHLFRAASLYALFVRSGEKDQGLRTQAVAEIEQVKQIGAGIDPDPRAFSPRFVSFFRSGGVVASVPAPAANQP